MRVSVIGIGIVVGSILTGFAQAADNAFVEHVRGFDTAQSRLVVGDTIPYLADDVSISIRTCENTVERFNLETFKRAYSTIQQHANRLTIHRQVDKLEDCDGGTRCTIHSRLSERVVAYGGQYDKTTRSVETTRVERVEDSLKITSINASIECG
ncbi:MAG: hypothetical protein AAF493_25720 [Pseudomonadota bacterium]